MTGGKGLDTTWRLQTSARLPSLSGGEAVKFLAAMAVVARGRRGARTLVGGGSGFLVVVRHRRRVNMVSVT